jgi:hypothetical protein
MKKKNCHIWDGSVWHDTESPIEDHFNSVATISAGGQEDNDMVWFIGGRTANKGDTFYEIHKKHHILSSTNW